MLKDKIAVLFDLDGTLVDSMGVWAEIDKEYLGAYHMQVPAGLQKDLEGLGFTETACYFKERFHLPDSIDQIKLTWNRMAMDKYKNEVKLKPYAKEFLYYLHQRDIKMAVASSNSRELIEAVLVSTGVRKYFQEIIICCEVRKGKPAPDVYLEAAKRLQVEASKCLVFEDIVPGIQAGKAAGMSVCAVKDEYSIFQEKEKKECADYFIASYEDIIKGTYEVL